MIISVFKFMPFASRVGESVIGLRFAHDDILLATLKAELASHKGQAVDPARNIHQPGGWQPKSRCWFVEESIWPSVREHLQVFRPDLTFVEGARPDDVVHHEPAMPYLCVGSRWYGDHPSDPDQGYVVQEPGGRTVYACDTDCLQRYLDAKRNAAGQTAMRGGRR